MFTLAGRTHTGKIDITIEFELFPFALKPHIKLDRNSTVDARIIQQNRWISFRMIQRLNVQICSFWRTVPNNISSGHVLNISLDDPAISEIKLAIKHNKIAIHQEFPSGIYSKQQRSASSSLKRGIVHLIHNYFHFSIFIDIQIKFQSHFFDLRRNRSFSFYPGSFFFWRKKMDK